MKTKSRLIAFGALTATVSPIALASHFPKPPAGNASQQIQETK